MNNAATSESRLSSAKVFRRVLPQAVFLLVLWLIFSGKFDVIHIGLGVVSVLFILWLDRKLPSATMEPANVSLSPHWGRFALYLPWLIWQMLLSSWQVGKLALSPSVAEKLNPNLVEFYSAQPHVLAKVALGNSITLTPGTITLDIDGDRFLVHSLTDETTKSLFEGTMQRKVARVYRTDLSEPVTGARILTERQRL